MITKISIVIPSFNGRDLLAKNLPIVLAACRAWSREGWEVIVTDDGSTDGSVSFLKKNFSEVRVVSHANLRFAQNCNSGVVAARGDVVVLLNNDVAPERDFLQPLIKPFENPDVFAVGCREKEIKNGKIFYVGRGTAGFKRGLWVHWRAKDQNVKETFWTSGGSMAVDRKKWQQLGGMDKLFYPAYWEDVDLSYRARHQGWRILFEPNSVVNHRHETTNRAAIGVRSMIIYAYKNQFLFGWKHNDFGQMLKHLFWLPYHLTMTNWRSKGLLGRGFWLALKQLPEVL